MDKIKIRSDKELNDRKKGFIEITDLFDELKITYFLQGGVLLGAIRNQNFIKWDWDVEISLFKNDLIENWDLIINSLKEKNFNIHKKNNNRTQLKIELYKYQPIEITSFTIFGWSYDLNSNCYFRKKIKIPEIFFKKMDNIKFFEKVFKCPGPAEKYLEYQYGDWKKEKRTFNKNLYLSKEFYSGTTFTENLIKKFKRIINYKSKN